MLAICDCNARFVVNWQRFMERIGSGFEPLVACLRDGIIIQGVTSLGLYGFVPFFRFIPAVVALARHG